ncbi:hypothetical protein EYS14_19965 [Alteromonadaceae bacterium M269]|nr:hypothetical protein EYS14_19965 [Alteromonadaceae bacterium M269]
MENNLYQAPESSLETENEVTSAYEYTGPRSRPIGDAMEWIGGGFSIFKQSPGPWIVTLLVGFVVSIIINLIPVIGAFAAMFTTYVWIGGLMMGCQAVSEGKPFDVKYLFAGFSHRVGALIGLSTIYLVIFVIIMFGAMGSTFTAMMTDPEAFAAGGLDTTTFLLSFLIAMALLIPVMMLMWFAPILIVLQNMSVIEAMKASFVGCLKNVLPFLLYGVVFLFLYILGAIPLMLGLLVVVPMLFGSMHASYQSIYLSPKTQD